MLARMPDDMAVAWFCAAPVPPGQEEKFA